MDSDVKLLSSRTQGSPATTMIELSRLYYLSRAIHVAVEIGVADLIPENGISATELAQKTEMDPSALRRLMQFLASYGVFEQAGNEHFGPTDFSEVLRKDHPNSVLPIVRYVGTAWWNAAGALLHSVKTGAAAFLSVNGMSFYEYLTHDSDMQRRFNEGMARISDADDEAVVDAYDFSRFRRVVDVGGGRGGLLAQILKRNPGVESVLFDRPQVIDAPIRLQETGQLGRCQCLGGDFLQSVPEGAECYIIKGVLQDFDDEACQTVLVNCRNAVIRDGRILVVERLPPSNVDGPHPNIFMDIHMMVLFGGQVRRESDWSRIFDRSGLEIGELVHTTADFTVIEGILRE